jgi:hypothetical protein
MCAIPTFDILFGHGVDPCPGNAKWLAITAQCARGTGRSGGGASCAANGTACPLPVGWSQYNLTLSTVIEPGGDLAPGYFELNASRPFGLVSLDWSVANKIWRHDNQNQSTVEATLTENCRRIKAVSPRTILSWRCKPSSRTAPSCTAHRRQAGSYTSTATAR